MTAAPNPTLVSRTVPESRIDWLGRLIDRQYGTYKGTEYVVDRHAASLESFTPQDGEILVQREHVALIDPDDPRSAMRSFSYHRGYPVASGTFASLVSGRKQRPDEKKPRAWDRLAGLDMMVKREPIRMVAGTPSPLDKGLPPGQFSEEEREGLASLVSAARRQDTRTIVESGGNVPPQRSIRGVIDYLAQRGIELDVVGGYLRAKSEKVIRHDVAEALDRLEPLIVGELQGRPVSCAACGAPAVTVVIVSMPACAEHAE